MNRIYTFKNILTEYTEIGNADNRGGKVTAITNIMLHPVNDEQILKELFAIYKAYTKMTDDKAISDKFFKQINKPDNAFNGYYKLKVRRRLFPCKFNKGKYTAANINGEFEQKVIDASVMRKDGDGKLVKVKPNYGLFIHDLTGDKPQCFTDRRKLFEDGFVNKADVQVVVEKVGANGIQLTLFKYRKLEHIIMDSSNKTNTEEVVVFDDGLDALFNFDESELNITPSSEELSDGDLELDDEIKWI